MSKTDEVIVNEDMMRGIMMREVPVSEIGNAVIMPDAEKPAQPEEALHVEPTAPPAKKSYTKKKKKEDDATYEERFLVVEFDNNRVTVNLSRPLFERIRTILPVVAPNVPLACYISNIVADHLEQYRDEINELYTKKFQPPL